MLVIVAPVSSTRLVALLAGAWTALAACASFGAIAFSGPPSSSLGTTAGSRIGILPADPWHLAIALLAGLIVLVIGWTRARGAAIAVSPLVLVFLPWLPFDVPAAFLAWTGALASLVWIGVGIALVQVAIGVALGPRHVTLLPPPRPVVLAAVLSCIVFALAAWFASPAIPGGDEPHYLVITQSLLYDRDLRIENNHARGDYRAYFAGDLTPHSIRRGRNGEIYSIHAPGVPALVLPAFAIGGYHGVVVFLVLLSAAGCALAWWLAWRAAGSLSAAWFGWAAVTACAPFLLESFTVFPDAPGAVAVLTGFWALMRAGWESASLEGIEGREAHRRNNDKKDLLRSPSIPSNPSSSDQVWLPWLLHGLGLALLPWMHTRFSVLAATLGGLVLVRLAHVPNPLAKASAFLALPAVSALAWLFFFTIVYGAPDPSAPYGSQPQNVLAFFPNGAGGLLFDQGFGLFATAPVLAIALAGFATTRRLAVEWLIVAVPYLLAVATFAMWWAGMSGPARFLVPLLLPLAIPAACAWASLTSRGARAVMLASLVVTVWLSAVMAGGGDGRLGYHSRNEGGATAAPWMQWANHVIDLPTAFPAFVPLPVGTPSAARVTAARTGFAAALPWGLCLGGASLFLAWILNRRHARPETAVAAATLTFGCAAMLAMSITWRMAGVSPETPAPAQMSALRRLATGRVVAIDLPARRRLSVSDAWAMRILAPIGRSVRTGPRNRPLAAFPAVPAGSYVISARRRAAPAAGDGWVMVGVGNDQFAIVTEPIAAYAAGVPIDLPVDVRALTIRADEGARDQLDAIELRPIAPGRPLSSGMARRAVRYGTGVVFFLDDRAFPEPSGFWVGGARDTTVAVRPDRPGTIALSLRNGAAANVVKLESGSWQEEIALQAGEERRIDVPIDASRGAALLTIRSSAGFRPSEVDRASADHRWLGVYCRLLTAD